MHYNNNKYKVKNEKHCEVNICNINSSGIIPGVFKFPTCKWDTVEMPLERLAVPGNEQEDHKVESKWPINT